MLDKTDAKLINTKVLAQDEDWPQSSVNQMESDLLERGWLLTLENQHFTTPARAITWLLEQQDA